MAAREIHVSLPYHAESSYILTAPRGIHTDTLTTGTLDNKGNATIILPDVYANYSGMSSLRLENGIQLELILNNENFLVTCLEETPYIENVIFTDSPENTFISEFYQKQRSYQTKLNLLNNLITQYSNDDPFLFELEKEAYKIIREDSLLQVRIEKPPLYAARFLELNELTRNLYDYPELDTEEQTYIKDYTIHNLNYTEIYNSSLWRFILTAWANTYEGRSLEIQDEFVQDALTVFMSIDDFTVQSEYANDIISLCEAKGWDDAKVKIAYGIYQSGLLPNPTGSIGRLIRNMGLFSQQKAPDIDLGQGIMMSSLNSPRYLILFYESGCENCDRQVQLLKYNQKLIEDQGYTIVSVSADYEEDIDRGTRDYIGWKYKLCDYQGYEGINFENYGILGTPTLFILDNELNILGRYTKLEQIGIL